MTVTSDNPHNNAAIEIRNLSVSYKTEPGYVKAVDDVSFTIKKGEILGLAGESACGKTTTALSVMRLLPANALVEGHILFGDKDVLQMSEDELCDFRWKRVSLIPQGSMNSLDPVIPVGNQIIEAIQAHEKSLEMRRGRTRRSCFHPYRSIHQEPKTILMSLAGE